MFERSTRPSIGFVIDKGPLEESSWSRTLNSTIYTIGTPDDPAEIGRFGLLEAQCARYGITTIIDIRSESDVPNEGDFSHEELPAIAAEAGYGYRWLGDRFAEGPPTADTMASVLDEVAGLTHTGVAALLCASVSLSRRERADQLAPHLSDRGFIVMHIRLDGSAQPFQDHLGW